MKFLVDENVPHSIIKSLNEAGHSVLDIKSAFNQVLSDTDLLEIAKDTTRIVITYDRDFAIRPELINKPVPRVVIRLLYSNLKSVEKRLFEVLEIKDLDKSIVVIYPHYNEVRKLKNL